MDIPRVEIRVVMDDGLSFEVVTSQWLSMNDGKFVVSARIPDACRRLSPMARSALYAVCRGVSELFRANANDNLHAIVHEPDLSVVFVTGESIKDGKMEVIQEGAPKGTALRVV